jgi:hypothetical protein
MEYFLLHSSNCVVLWMLVTCRKTHASSTRFNGTCLNKRHVRIE